MTQAKNPFRYFDSSPEVIRLVVMMYVRYPLSLRNVEDLLFERGIDICHETVRLWWNRFGPMFAGEIRRKRVQHMRAYTHWRWHLDEVYVKINGGYCQGKQVEPDSRPIQPLLSGEKHEQNQSRLVQAGQVDGSIKLWLDSAVRRSVAARPHARLPQCLFPQMHFRRSR
jgi:putative transposase